MLQRFCNDVVLALGHGCRTSHLAGRRRCRPALTIIYGLTLGLSCKVHAQPPVDAADNANKAPAPVACLPDGQGFLKARLSGAVQAELAWGNEDTECTGAVRPDGGIRVRFSHKDGADGGRLVLLFGVAGLREGQSAKALPVNVTVIREGLGEFYSTQGDTSARSTRCDRSRWSGFRTGPDRTGSLRAVFVHILHAQCGAPVSSCCPASTMQAGSTSTPRIRTNPLKAER